MFEYFIDIQCPIQRKKSPQEFMRTAKIRRYAEVFESKRAELAAVGESIDEQVIVLAFPVKTGWFRSSNEVKAKDLFKIRNELEKSAGPICEKCPINIAGCTLGCCAAITYPISDAGEQWLMDHFNPPDGEKGYLPYHIRDSKVTGAYVDTRRPGPRGEEPYLYASPKAIYKRVSADGPEYSSSQILEFLSGCQPKILTATLYGLCIDFNVVNLEPSDKAMLFLHTAAEHTGIEVSAEDTQKITELRMRLAKKLDLVNPPQADDEDSVNDLKGFLASCWLAYLCGMPLRVDI